MRQADAVTTLAKSGFGHLKTVDQYSVVPRGQVAMQSPLCGAHLDTGSTVTLTISKGPDPAWAGALPALSLPPCGATGATVRGQVTITSIASKRPRVGVKVVALPINTGTLAPGQPAGRATTDSNGRFSMRLPPGPYVLSAPAAGDVPCGTRSPIDVVSTDLTDVQVVCNGD